MKTTHSMDLRSTTTQRMGIGMKWHLIATTLLMAVGLSAGGCNTAGPDIDRVQTNLVDKALFEGEWWYGQTIVDVKGDEAQILSNGWAPFTGDMAWSDFGIDSTESTGTMARIRWVIDQNYLYAFRSYELIDGGNDDGRSAEFRGQPLAAYRIQAHVDVRQEYDTVTGEVRNVTSENTTDRFWYQRDFMRVDWSQNLITAFFTTSVDLQNLLNVASITSVPFQFQAGAHDDFPAEYEPQFVRIGDDTTYRFRDEWPSGTESTVHYMSFVAQQLWSPGEACFQYGTPCSSAAVTTRAAFLRIPPNHQYAAESETHTEFDRFGMIRSTQRTYVRGGHDRDELHQYCANDGDCGAGGSCDLDTGDDPEVNICQGGLSTDYGLTDFLTFYRPRHNFYMQSFRDTPASCRGDWECDGRYDGTNGIEGSICDRAARRCTVPPEQRSLRPVTYHLNPHFPTHLVRSAFQTVGEWNEVFMRGYRAMMGRPPAVGEPIACQNTDPTQYCWCGSPEDNGGSCSYKYDPFAAAPAGVQDAYDCHIEGPAEPEHPTSFADYTDEVYDYRFVGEECMFFLAANSCDVDETKACENLGDIRYNFFNLIEHGHVQFGGVSLPLMDPRNGELIVSNANIVSESLESVATYGSQFFPVLRGEASSDEYFNSEDLRNYFSNLGQTELPAAMATASGPGVGPGDTSRPSLPVDFHPHIAAMMERGVERVESLRGTEGRALIFSSRQRNLEGTTVESQLLQSVGRDMFNATVGEGRMPLANSAMTDTEVANQISPFRAGGIDAFESERNRFGFMGRHNVDPPFAPELRSQFWQYWANQFGPAVPAFAGRDLSDRNKEAAMRMAQAFARGIGLHEFGHSLGMNHNFGGSFDRDNYYDGYYNIARRIPLPVLSAYDAPGLGGNANGYTDALEIDRWQVDLRTARNERAAAGIGNVQANSIMEYPGDLSDLSGLGRYDVGAITWNYFNQIEAFTADPVLDRPNTSLDGLEQSDITPRTFLNYYRGGDLCHFDTDCPGNTIADQPMSQRCIRNPRYAPVPEPCGGESEQACVCSNFDEDFKDYMAGAAFRDPSEDPTLFPVNYLYCNDERTSDISWCNRFDAGESFQEAVDHWRRTWEYGYPFSYYRHYRRGGAQPGHLYGSLQDAVKIFQHLYFRYFYEPEFRQQVGSLGLDDQFSASIDVMNWLGEMASLPDVGSYAFDASANVYRQISTEPGAAGAAFSLEPGIGYNMWSSYETGQNGFFRTARAGVFLDKFLALWGLARRDWGLTYSYDERFYINFYDLFPIEMKELFGSYIQNNVRGIAPRVTLDADGPNIHHANIWRGEQRCGVSGFEPCRGSIEDTYTEPAIDGTSNEILRDWATIQALSEFPVYYDTTFESQLSIYKLGSGDGHTIPATRADGTPTCGYGEIGCTEPDYIVYESERFHLSYIAVTVRSRFEYNLEEEQVGFNLLRGMQDKQDRIHELEVIGSPSAAEVAELARLRNELQGDESYLEYLINLQHRFGVSSYL